jgi:Ni/Co efflux regulator RcnB
MSLKIWFRAGAIAAVSLALSTTIAVAQDHGHGHDKHDRDDDDDHGNGHGKGHEKGHGHEAYSDHDRDIHDWYRAHYSHLPPGLAKRDRLPPGLERQLSGSWNFAARPPEENAALPSGTRNDIPPPPPNYAHFVIGGNLVLVNRANFQIADVFHFEIN